MPPLAALLAVAPRHLACNECPLLCAMARDERPQAAVLIRRPGLAVVVRSFMRRHVCSEERPPTNLDRRPAPCAACASARGCPACIFVGLAVRNPVGRLGLPRRRLRRAEKWAASYPVAPPSSWRFGSEGARVGERRLLGGRRCRGCASCRRASAAPGTASPSSRLARRS